MIKIQAVPGAVISLGHAREHLVRAIVFDFSEWRETYGEGVLVLAAVRPGESVPYPVALIQEDNIAYWPITETDTALPGYQGQAELRYYVGDSLKKSETWKTRVEPAVSTPDDTNVPNALQNWFDQLVETGVGAMAAAQVAEAAKKDSTGAAKNAEDAQRAAEQAFEDAAAAKRVAEDAQSLARASQLSAEASATAAAESFASAEGSAAEAQAALTSAQTAQQAAEAAMITAEEYKNDAAQSATDLAEAVSAAETAQQEAETARSGAATAESEATAAAEAARQSQTAAAQSATTAETAKSAAEKSAAAAAKSAADAAEIAGGDVTAVVSQLVGAHNTDPTAHEDIRAALEAAGLFVISQDYDSDSGLDKTFAELKAALLAGRNAVFVDSDNFVYPLYNCCYGNLENIDRVDFGRVTNLYGEVGLVIKTVYDTLNWDHEETFGGDFYALVDYDSLSYSLESVKEEAAPHVVSFTPDGNGSFTCDHTWSSLMLPVFGNHKFTIGVNTETRECYTLSTCSFNPGSYSFTSTPAADGSFTKITLDKNGLTTEIIGGGSGATVVSLIWDGDGGYTCDHTFAAVQELLRAGKSIAVVVQPGMTQCLVRHWYEDSEICFCPPASVSDGGVKAYFLSTDESVTEEYWDPKNMVQTEVGIGLSGHNTNPAAHADIRELISGAADAAAAASTAAEEAKTTAAGKADASHTQSASTITAGTFPGLVRAQNLALNLNGLRNITISDVDLEAGVSELATGNLYFVYE